MILTFGPYRLDAEQFRLSRDGAEVRVEPLVFDLIALLARNPGVVIDRDRMIAEVWRGRIVSDATIDSAVRSARRALGDSGETQAYIQTVRARGFRFAAEVAGAPAAQALATTAAPPSASPPAPLLGPIGGAPAIAVLPFLRYGDPAPFEGLEEALPHEIIGALSRLAWLFVIARGSTFRLRGAEAEPGHVGATLGAGYCLSGTVELFGQQLAVTVELADTRSRGVIWGDRFEAALVDLHGLRAAIVEAVAARIETGIQQNEALIAETLAPESLDAWQAFHLGLKHIHRYDREGTAAAQALFERAVRLDPRFARARGGLAYAHFQNAFMRYTPDRAAEIDASVRAAEEGLALDPLDPFLNFNMGRSFWIRNDPEAAVPWLERATLVSPSYAQGIYSRALIDMLAGRGPQAVVEADLAMRLSPLDPLLHAMRGTKALALAVAGEDAAAAEWGTAAARTVRSHVIIDLIACATNALAGDEAMARRWAASARARRPGVTRADFLEALPISDPDARARVEAALARHGF